MKPQDFLIDFMLDRIIGVLLLLAIGLAFAGWFGFFRMKEDRDTLQAKSTQLEKDHKDACSELNELRASVAGGWPITF